MIICHKIHDEFTVVFDSYMKQVTQILNHKLTQDVINI